MWENVSPTPRATTKVGCKWLQLKGPQQGLWLCIPNSRGQANVWESASPTQGATPKRTIPYLRLKGPRQSFGVGIPKSRGHTQGWKFVSQPQGLKHKCGSPYPKLTLKTQVESNIFNFWPKLKLIKSKLPLFAGG